MLDIQMGRRRSKRRREKKDGGGGRRRMEDELQYITSICSLTRINMCT